VASVITVTGRRQLQSQLLMLRELREIMTAMKNISHIETHKLKRFLATQQMVVGSVQLMAADFLCHWPQPLQAPANAPVVCLVVGSERGFCGDFNVAVRRALDEECGASTERRAVVIPMGRKLSVKLEGDARVGAALESPSIADEVQPALVRLADTLGALQINGEPFSPLSLMVIHHEPLEQSSRVRVSRPLQSLGARGRKCGLPPLLNLPPERMFAELVHHYLFADLQGILYQSLMAEHQQRLQHLEGAIRRLDRQCAELTHRGYALRQEEITEEIELILLSAEASGHEVSPLM
jgi:F-type H+-transporting ATPase subunit gamma